MKPMLAATCDDVTKLTFPLYASPKLDGVRALVIDGVLHSRSLKPIPNPHVNILFGRKELSGLDGELILGKPTASDVYRQTVGAVSRHEGTPDVAFYAFDRHDKNPFPFYQRWVNLAAPKGVTPLEQHEVKDTVELLQYEADCLAAGYEGLILRSPGGLYKYGRSTMKEQGMVKLKRFTDGEAEVLEVLEEEHNANTAKKNELGRTARSTAKAGMVPTGRAGALAVRDLVTGVEFSIGTGLDDAWRALFWKNRKKVVGRMVKYKSFSIGVKDKPRFPVFLGMREPWDL